MKKAIFFIVISLFLLNSEAVLAVSTIEQQLDSIKSRINTVNAKTQNFASQELNLIYPIGSVFLTNDYSTITEVSTALGGTWEVYGAGRTIIGTGTGTDSRSVSQSFANGTSGGKYSHSLTTSEMPSHTHSISAPGTAASAGAHTHTIPALAGSTNVQSLTGSFGSGNGSGFFWYQNFAGVFSSGGASYNAFNEWEGYSAYRNWGINMNASHNHSYSIPASTTSASSTHTHSVSFPASTTGTNGSNSSHNNVQPYIVVYMYKRVS